MKRKDRLPTITAWVAGIFLGLCVLVIQVWGATQTTYQYFGNPGADTTIVVRRNTADGALIDSTMRLAADSAFPHYVELTWDDTKDYSLWILNHFSEGWWPDVPQWKKFTGSAASVDYGRIYDTMQFAIDGNGEFTINFYVLDSSNSNAPIPNANVTIRNQAQTALLGKTVSGTDANGLMAVAIDSGIYVKAVTSLAGYIFTPVNDSFRIDSAEVDTIFGYAFSPSAPGAASVANVYGWIVDDPSGTLKDVNGKKVTFTLANDVWNVCDSTGIIELSTFRYTDATGKFEVDLMWSSCLGISGSDTASNIQYEMEIQGRTGTKVITVPDSTTYRVWP